MQLERPTPNRILIIMVGLPRSGKSTLAKYTGCPIVSRDAIRMTLGCYPFDKEREEEVSEKERFMVDTLFNAGHTAVVLDACHVRKYQRDRWKSDQWRRFFFVVDTDAVECKKRARATGQDYLVPFIEKMNGYYQQVTEKERKDC